MARSPRHRTPTVAFQSIFDGAQPTAILGPRVAINRLEGNALKTISAMLEGE